MRVKFLRVLSLIALVAGFPTGFSGARPEVPKQPSISFGRAGVSLGMATAHFEKQLAGTALHLKFLDERTARYVHPSEDAVLDSISRLGGHKIGHSQRDAPQLPVAKEVTNAIQ